MKPQKQTLNIIHDEYVICHTRSDRTHSNAEIFIGIMKNENNPLKGFHTLPSTEKQQQQPAKSPISSNYTHKQVNKAALGCINTEFSLYKILIVCLFVFPFKMKNKFAYKFVICQ